MGAAVAALLLDSLCVPRIPEFNPKMLTVYVMLTSLMLSKVTGKAVGEGMMGWESCNGLL
ncbi:MAG: hypothetical protein QW767_03900 [Thermoprotei archaeon]